MDVDWLWSSFAASGTKSLAESLALQVRTLAGQRFLALILPFAIPCIGISGGALALCRAFMAEMVGVCCLGEDRVPMMKLLSDAGAAWLQGSVRT
jgi:hypothetical protein